MKTVLYVGLPQGHNQYGYDGDGKQVRQPGLYYVWSSVLDKVAFEVDGNANVQRAFVYLGSEVIALQSTDGAFYWAHTDHLSSGRMLTNTAGSVVYRADFDPFGQTTYEWSSSGNVNLNSGSSPATSDTQRDWITRGPGIAD